MPLTLGAVAAALVAEAAATPSEVGGGAGQEVLDRLVGWLRRVFAADQAKAGAAALARVATPNGLVELAYALNRRASDDAEFRTDLMALVEEAGSALVDIGSITQAAWGVRSVPAIGSLGSGPPGDRHP